jgi:hypothetical protein
VRKRYTKTATIVKENSMRESYSGCSMASESETSRLDIDLEQMASGRPDRFSEAQARNTPKSVEEKIQSEENLLGEYQRIVTLYRQLQEAIEGGTLPDFRRVSVSLPLEIDVLLDETVDSLMELSLYRSAEKSMVKKELETMIRRHSFEEKIAGMQSRIALSTGRLAQLRMTEDPDAINRRRTEEILAKIKETIPMEPLPVVVNQSPRRDLRFLERGGQEILVQREKRF